MGQEAATSRARALVERALADRRALLHKLMVGEIIAERPQPKIRRPPSVPTEGGHG
jgi:hypothetical protein